MTTNAETVRLAFRIGYHKNLIDQESTKPDNYVDAAVVIVATILELLELISIHSIPGNEWERFDTLRRHCHLIDALLLMPTTERDTIRDHLTEAIAQLSYLMEMDSINWAAVIETLCFNEGGDIDLAKRHPRHHSPAGRKSSGDGATDHSLQNRHRRAAR